MAIAHESTPGRESDIAAFVRFVARVSAKATLILALPLLATAAYVLCLRRTGELLPASAVAALSASPQKILWLTGYYDTGFLHKTDVARHLAPQVAVVGSSRVMQVRARFFDKLAPNAFYNLGGCCTSILEAQRAIHALSASAHRPKVILLGVDPWWFESSAPRPSRLRAMFGDAAPTIVAHAIAVKDELSAAADRVQVLQRAWRDPRFRLAMRQHFSPVRDTTTHALLIGVSARVNRSGFRNDGSYRYGTLIAAEETWPSDSAESRLRAARFDQATVADIQSRSDTQGAYFFDGAIQTLGAILKETAVSGERVIVFVAPIAPAAQAIFDARVDAREFNAKFSASVGTMCRQAGVPFVDDYDARDLGATDRDFYDWAHPSERLVATLMSRLFSDSTAASILSPYGDRHRIDADLAKPGSRWQLYDY